MTYFLEIRDNKLPFTWKQFVMNKYSKQSPFAWVNSFNDFNLCIQNKLLSIEIQKNILFQNAVASSYGLKNTMAYKDILTILFAQA